MVLAAAGMALPWTLLAGKGFGGDRSPGGFPGLGHPPGSPASQASLLPMLGSLSLPALTPAHSTTSSCSRLSLFGMFLSLDVDSSCFRELGCSRAPLGELGIQGVLLVHRSCSLGAQQNCLWPWCSGQSASSCLEQEKRG